MLEKLKLHNFPTGHQPKLNDKGAFVLQTCQRSLVLSFSDQAVDQQNQSLYHWKHEADEAYIFLLETICGLNSKLLGENEIVGQFKLAYQQFLNNPNRDKQLIVILEKLFKDAKDIRTKYLTGLSQKTYASLTRKIILSGPGTKKVLILGSGTLAEDLINQFKKKAEVYICARNNERILELQQLHDIKILAWDDFYGSHRFSHIANTIGFEGNLFQENFFNEWKTYHPEGIFVDLGSPSVIETNLKKEHGVWKLEDIFTEGACHESFKWNQISQAKQAMSAIVEKRRLFFKKKMSTPQLWNKGSHHGVYI
jgi:glutamyl-tRNA reductase